MSKSKSKTSSKTNVQLAIAKSIKSIVTKRDAFSKAIESYEELTQEVLENLNLNRTSKNQELIELDSKVKNQKKQHQIETDQWLQQYRYDGAIKFLKEHGEVPISQAGLDAMEDQKSKFKSTVEASVKKEKDRGIGALKSAVDRCRLEHKASTAVIQATLDQQKNEIANLQRVIENQKQEISAQRNLTKDVAESLRSAPISQSFGK